MRIKEYLKKNIRILLLVLFFLCSHAIAQEIEIHISLEKSTFILYERIPLDVIIKISQPDNTKKAYHNFVLILKNEKGDVIPVTSTTSFNNYLEFEILKSVGEEFHTFNLLEFYNDIETKRKYSAPWGFFDYLSSGNYTLQANFNGVYSKQISFSIVEPTDEELEALNLLGDAAKIPQNAKTYPIILPIYQELVKRFPNSAYFEICSWFIRYNNADARLARKNGSFDEYNYITDMIDMFPNSTDVQYWIKGFKYHLDDNLLKEKLLDIAKTYPNDRAGKNARLYLKSLSSGYNPFH